MPGGRAGLRGKTGRETGREGRMEEQGREVEAGSRTGVAARGWPAGGWPAMVGCFGAVFGRFSVGLRWSAASGWCSAGFRLACGGRLLPGGVRPVPGWPAVRPPVRAKRAPAGTTARRGALFHVKRMDGRQDGRPLAPTLCHAGYDALSAALLLVVLFELLVLLPVEPGEVASPAQREAGVGDGKPLFEEEGLVGGLD